MTIALKLKRLLNHLLNKTLKIASVFLLFISPIITIIVRYSTNEVVQTVVVEETNKTMPMWALAMIGLFSLALVMWLGKQIANSLAQHPFSFGSILAYGAVLLVVVFNIYLIVNKVREWIVYLSQLTPVLIVEYTDEFTSNMDYHLRTLQIIGLEITFALIIVGFAIARKLKS